MVSSILFNVFLLYLKDLADPDGKIVIFSNFYLFSQFLNVLIKISKNRSVTLLNNFLRLF